MDLNELSLEYEKKQPVFGDLDREALFVLKEALKRTRIKCLTTSRIKTWESFVNKVSRRQAERPFEEIEDIVGLRVVCLFLSDVAEIGNIIRSAFSVSSEDNKIDGYDAASFGYMSLHFVAALTEHCTGPRYDKLHGLKFEVQVRTIAMDAWASISHYLDYKSDADIPTDLRRDFYAISGLFYVADKHFEMFFKASKESRKEMTELFAKDTPFGDQEINLDSLSAYLQRKLPHRLHVDPKTVSELVEELTANNYRTIGAIEQAFEIGWEAFTRYEKDHPPAILSSGVLGKEFSDVGVVRVLLEITDDKFCSDGWGWQEVYRSYRRLIKSERP